MGKNKQESSKGGKNDKSTKGANKKGGKGGEDDDAKKSTTLKGAMKVKVRHILVSLTIYDGRRNFFAAETIYSLLTLQ